MEMKHISASEAKKISSSVISDADKTLELIFGEIKLRAGLGQTSFNWPVHENILEQVVKVLRESGYRINSSKVNENNKIIIEISW
ncbi:hypothetical protein ACV4R1_003040 [Salmonella enterica subsp. enterica serovar Montevideo]|uniref:Uncharacterized protein n=3 Tax=Salmonella enterica TaxID=28901 RepID=A0A5Y2YYH3_SALMO|nr:hypothetical protein [Salmonella enterica subsp. enterica serovar Montevideo]EAM8139885.1 hypothetical protein [Salmonella enterica]EBS3878622.1 hypothetical protein [Salmonella enterica subsp. enterica serovar Virchow]EBW8596068.1 hypothetical protein [Salmonella enterica subsp. enterica serovar Anatum]EBY3075107.1 hypothetical protein [Salmonella enterica subsp. enterica serovar Typhimurium]EBZ9516213.1 hypothetical protein [Salmonella enterica subsp. enterica serovar Eastbourne]ECD63070